MSGFEIVIYVAGLILLTKLFIKELIGVVGLVRRLFLAPTEPLPPIQQPQSYSKVVFWEL
jgi:hypothetical protein